jgi:hypothetical protein
MEAKDGILLLFNSLRSLLSVVSKRGNRLLITSPKNLENGKCASSKPLDSKFLEVGRAKDSQRMKSDEHVSGRKRRDASRAVEYTVISEAAHSPVLYAVNLFHEANTKTKTRVLAEEGFPALAKGCLALPAIFIGYFNQVWLCNGVSERRGGGPDDSPRGSQPWGY